MAWLLADINVYLLGIIVVILSLLLCAEEKEEKNFLNLASEIKRAVGHGFYVSFVVVYTVYSHLR